MLMVPILVIVLVPFVLVVATCYLLVALALHIAVVVFWLPRGRRVLFVYSNSPVWKPYLDAEVLPRLPPNSVILNWSDRKHWPKISLAVWVFRTFGGAREFNPIAMVFRAWGPPKKFRFWRAFKDFKHGKPQRVEQVQAALFACLDRSADQPIGR